jgi:predicted transcriptional regulator
MTSSSWEELSYVIRSKVRKSILLQLQNPKTPTILANELHTSIANISRGLRELSSKGIVVCMTPKVRVGRIYVATDKGKKISSKLRKMISKD